MVPTEIWTEYLRYTSLVRYRRSGKHEKRKAKCKILAVCFTAMKMEKADSPEKWYLSVMAHSSTPKIKAVGSSETFLAVWKIARRHIREDYNFHSHRGGNFKFRLRTFVTIQSTWQRNVFLINSLKIPDMIINSSPSLSPSPLITKLPHGRFIQNGRSILDFTHHNTVREVAYKHGYSFPFLFDSQYFSFYGISV